MIDTFKDIEDMSKKNEVPLADTLFIALNRYGVNYYGYDDNRVRFVLDSPYAEDDYYFAVCVNTTETPFFISDNKLLLKDEVIGNIKELEKDTCDSTYFRNGKREMTLNSNMRSQCKGCTFCGTYNLRPEDLTDLTNPGNLDYYINSILEENNMKSLSAVDGITVCTGCFKTEKDVVDHLILLRRELSKFGFNKKIKYIGSQIRSDFELNRIKYEIGDFSMFITTEIFSQRNRFMRQEKASLNLDKTIKLMDKTVNMGFDTTFLYILGLEDLNIFEENLQKVASHINKFPIVQIFQDYNSTQEKYRVPAAKELEYYLEARKILENVFENTDLHPESWENYRSLYYTKYKGKRYNSVRK